jgi:hypothetical protein
VKVLDFGLAKACDASASDASQSPTLTIDGTREGLLLGTVAYMSPEQARGHTVDKRTDIWAFGCVLFEMLTGQPAFAGATTSDHTAAILDRDPDWDALPASMSPSLHRLLRRCLEKNLKQRLHDIADARIEIDDLERAAESAPTIVKPGAPWPASARFVGALAATAAAIAVTIAAVMISRSAPAAEPIRFTLPQSEAQHLSSSPGLPSVSPDGRHIAFASGEMPDTSRLNVRTLGSSATRVLGGTEGALFPFWSPDSRFIAFTTGSGQLKKIDVSGGPAVMLADSADSGGAWGNRGVVLFSRRHSGFLSAPATEDGRLYRLPSDGGEALPATELDLTRHELQHAGPWFLPDGRRFIFRAISSDPTQSALYLASLDSFARTRLLDIVSSVQYVPGYLLYRREGTLMAQPFDEKNGRPTGDALSIVEDVDHGPTGIAAFSASYTGCARVPRRRRRDQRADLVRCQWQGARDAGRARRQSIRATLARRSPRGVHAPGRIRRL